MFKDSRVIITGVSSFLGDMLARAYLKQGAHVIGIDKNDSRLETEKYHFVKYDFRQALNVSPENFCHGKPWQQEWLCDRSQALFRHTLKQKNSLFAYPPLIFQCPAKTAPNRKIFQNP